jgi:MIT (microtubule interacting and transport) domain
MAESERKEEAARKCKYDFSGPQVTLSQQSEAATALECDLAGPLVTPQSDEALTVANLTANDLAHIASRAIAADVQEDYEKALPLYREALERLIMALNYEKDEDRKQMILERVDRYVKRAETLLDYLSRQAELKVERGRGASMKSKEEEDADARKKAPGALDSEKSMSKAVVRAQ